MAHLDTAQESKALEAYIDRGWSLARIAREHGIPERTLRRTAREGDWAAARKAKTTAVVGARVEASRLASATSAEHHRSVAAMLFAQTAADLSRRIRDGSYKPSVADVVALAKLERESEKAAGPTAEQDRPGSDYDAVRRTLDERKEALEEAGVLGEGRAVAATDAAAFAYGGEIPPPKKPGLRARRKRAPSKGATE